MMRSLAFTDTNRSHQTSVATTSQGEDRCNDKNNGGNATRKLRRRRQKKKKAAVLPVPLAKPSVGEKYAARDLYVSMRCDWKDRHCKYLKRVVMVNWEGNVLLDIPVRDFKTVKEKVKNFVKGKVIIGHGLDFCLYSLQVQHSWSDLRDCANYLPFMRQTHDPRSVMVVPRMLYELAYEFLDRDITQASDPIVEAARTAMDLYRHVRVSWENDITNMLRQNEIQRGMFMGQKMHAPTVHATQGAMSVYPSQNYVPQQQDPRSAGYAGRSFGPVFSQGSFESVDKLSIAPTEATLEIGPSFAPSDDSSLAASDKSIWTPTEGSQDVAHDANKKSSTYLWGLWTQRPQKERATEKSDDWLSQDGDEKEEIKLEGSAEILQSLQEEIDLIPNDLLESDHEGEDDVHPREESNHPVNESDWLDPPKRETNWFLRRMRSSAGGQKSTESDNGPILQAPANLFPETDDSGRNTLLLIDEPDQGLEESLSVPPPQPQQPESPRNKSWFMRRVLSSSDYDESVRPEGDSWFTRSRHSGAKEEEWAEDNKDSSSSRFSFFRRKSLTAEEKYAANEDAHQPSAVEGL